MTNMRERHRPCWFDRRIKIAPGLGGWLICGANRLNAVVPANTQRSGATHGISRSMAEAQGLGRGTAARPIRFANALQSRRTSLFKPSPDRWLTEILSGVVELNLSPPKEAVVLYASENGQCRPLQHTPPSLPVRNGRSGTTSQDREPHKTTTRFALMRRVTGGCSRLHRCQQSSRLVRPLDRDRPRGLNRHVVVDNRRTQSHARVARSLARQPDRKQQVSPTSPSRQDRMKRWLRELADRQVRREKFYNLQEMASATATYLAVAIGEHKPLARRASAKTLPCTVVCCNPICDTAH